MLCHISEYMVKYHQQTNGDSMGYKLIKLFFIQQFVRRAVRIVFIAEPELIVGL